MADYEVERKAYYHKDGMVLGVTVLENKSNKERIAYRLRINEIIEGSSPLAGITKVGREFECNKLRRLKGPCADSLWSLTENLIGFEKGIIETGWT
ncbi:hypothetical protein LCGC14_2080190 [marine sediment metagenome]|uniref:Uncharacterized protein n=1 Tax=marine sediment metagenome TaxID=412755 RepID=A0A0F9EG34_9ZZZZ